MAALYSQSLRGPPAGGAAQPTSTACLAFELFSNDQDYRKIIFLYTIVFVNWSLDEAATVRGRL